jgi:Fe-S-cluster-containing hydrogenase component 2
VEKEGTSEAPADPSRRDFLRAAAAPIVAFIALESIGGVGVATGATPRATKESTGVIFPDPTLCIGCLTCEVICSQVHKAQGLSDVPRIRIFNDPATTVDPVVQAAYPDRGKFHQEPCLQCPTAECLYVCPVDALQVDPKTGARFINEDKCVTCGRCNEACIFPVSSETTATNQLVFNQHSRITYDPDKDVFAKCDLCYWREGGPACVESCPINVRIRQGVIKVEGGRMCLSAPASTPETWDKLRAFQTFEGSPAPGKA